MALAFTAGVVTVFSDTALAIVVRDIFDGPRLVPANSWLESASQGGQILGPGAAGALAAAGLLRVSLLADALTFLASLASLMVVRDRGRAGRTPRPRVSWRALRRELADGITYLAATRLLSTLLGFLLVLDFCLGADKLVIFFARNTLHLSPGQAGLAISAGGVGGVLGAASTSLLCRWLGRLPAVTLACAASGTALILISTAASLPVLLAGNLLYTWAIVVASVTMRALRQILVPRDLLGRVTASWRLTGQGATLAGAVLAGAAAGWLGDDPRPVFTAAGALTLLTTTVAWLAALRREEIPAASSLGPR